MGFTSIVWDLDDDPEGNVLHCADNDITKEEIEDLFDGAIDASVSRSSGRPIVFGITRTGRRIMVVYEEIDAETVYPITAFEVPGR